MAVTEEEVRRIAVLARLAPDAQAIHRLTEELNGILDHVRVLERLGATATDAPPDAQDHAAFREPDLSPDPLHGDAPGTLAPAWKEGFFLVPRLPALDPALDGGREVRREGEG